MKHILKAKKRFLCLLLAGALAACLSPAALAAPDGVEVAPGYDYTRFKDAGITLNVYNWGEYISGGADGSMDVVKEFYKTIPILGICLGHQCIGEAFGGTVTYAKALFHGKQSEITHTGTGIFAGITSPVKVARYHSLAVQMDDLPECLTVMAQTKDGEIMAMQHKEYPVIGLQFHPESIYTEHGKRMVENFINGIN